MLHVQAAALDDEELRRLELADAAIDRERRGDVAEREVGVDRDRTPFAAHTRVLQQPADLRGEYDAVTVQQRDEQRPYAQVIARHDETAVRLVPERERERPAEARNAPATPFFVGVRDELRIRQAPELVAVALEAGAQFARVGQLGLGDDADVLRFVGGGPGRRNVLIRSRKPAQRDARRTVKALAGAAAVPDGVEHLLNDRTRKRLIRIEAEPSDQRDGDPLGLGVHYPDNQLADIVTIVAVR